MVFSFFKNLLGGGDRTDSEAKAPAAAALAAKPRVDGADFGADDEGEGTGATTANIEDFVRFVTKALVDSPDDIRLETVEKGRNVTINISCAKSDMGKIIGRSGKTISAIRALAAGAAGKAGKKVSVEVLD